MLLCLACWQVRTLLHSSSCGGVLHTIYRVVLATVSMDDKQGAFFLIALVFYVLFVVSNWIVVWTFKVQPYCITNACACCQRAYSARVVLAGEAMPQG